jgi:hypothetical protein
LFDSWWAEEYTHDGAAAYDFTLILAGQGSGLPWQEFDGYALVTTSGVIAQGPNPGDYVSFDLVGSFGSPYSNFLNAQR